MAAYGGFAGGQIRRKPLLHHIMFSSYINILK
ncbi:UNVERIFIED_ORG: hypothetical protein J2X80_005672 [Pseudomonas fluorescens]|nr:hypothetical protein [Pseudomonas fluorescens]